jgi:hypothetical protein
LFAPELLPKDARALMWKSLVIGNNSLATAARRLLQTAQVWSRPVRVAVHALADIRMTKAELVAENALLRQQLMAAKRHLGRPQISKPEKVAITLWARQTTGWQRTFLLFSTRHHLALAPRDVQSRLVEEIAPYGKRKGEALA